MSLARIVVSIASPRKNSNAMADMPTRWSCDHLVKYSISNGPIQTVIVPAIANRPKNSPRMCAGATCTTIDRLDEMFAVANTAMSAYWNR